MYRNSEGYVDPTAGAAMATVKREENAELNDRNHRLIQVIRNIVDIAGFEIVGRVTLKHKKSGKVFYQFDAPISAVVVVVTVKLQLVTVKVTLESLYL